MDASNYCRNPESLDTGDRPWCYTMNPDKRWEYCNVRKCCYEGIGKTYNGKMAKTSSGLTCQAWASSSPHKPKNIKETDFPGICLLYKQVLSIDFKFYSLYFYSSEGNFVDAANYCRNPDSNTGDRPWCYTTDPNKRWEYCDVPKC